MLSRLKILNGIHRLFQITTAEKHDTKINISHILALYLLLCTEYIYTM